MNELNIKLKEYKEITIEIDNLLNEDNYLQIDYKLEKRQEIIDSIRSVEKNKAYDIYIDMGLDVLDMKIREKLITYLEQTKEEIKEYRKTKAVNSMYSRNRKEKINIFSKKV